MRRDSEAFGKTPEAALTMASRCLQDLGRIWRVLEGIRAHRRWLDRRTMQDRALPYKSQGGCAIYMCPGHVVVLSSSWGARPWVSLRSGLLASGPLLGQLLEHSLAYLALSDASNDTAWTLLLDLWLLLQWQQNCRSQTHTNRGGKILQPNFTGGLRGRHRMPRGGRGVPV